MTALMEIIPECFEPMQAAALGALQKVVAERIRQEWGNASPELQTAFSAGWSELPGKLHARHPWLAFGAPLAKDGEDRKTIFNFCKKKDKYLEPPNFEKWTNKNLAKKLYCQAKINLGKGGAAKRIRSKRKLHVPRMHGMNGRRGGQRNFTKEFE